MYGVYRQLAAEFQLALSPPDPGMMTFNFVLAGNFDGHPIHLSRWCGKGARIDITSPLQPHLDLGFALTRSGVMSKVAEWLGKTDIQLDDAEFDRAFTIRGDEPARVRALLNPALRNTIAGITAKDFELSDAEFSATRPVSDEDHRTLVYALDEAVRVARAVGEAHPAVPHASTVAAHHDAWTTYARAQEGFQVGTTPLWMQGRLGNTLVHARAARNRPGDFSLQLVARLERPLPVQLNVVPQRDALAAWGNASKDTGDASFDRIFDVMRAPHVEVLDAELRGRLVQLAHLGPVRLSGSEIQLFTSAKLEPRRVPDVLEDLRGVLQLLARNVLGPGDAYR
jgi:hypothetical protein